MLVRSRRDMAMGTQAWSTSPGIPQSTRSCQPWSQTRARSSCHTCYGALQDLRERRLCGPWRAHDVAWRIPRAGSAPRLAAATAWSPVRPYARHDGASPRSCDAPRPVWGHRMSDHKILCSHTSWLGPRSLRRLSLFRFGLPPAPDLVQACQSVGRTSQWTCPHPHGSPRGPRTAQPALRRFLPHPNLNNSLTQPLSQPGDLGLKLLLPGRGLTCLDPSTTTFKELPSPIPDRLPGNLLPADCLSNRDLTVQHGQHDP